MPQLEIEYSAKLPIKDELSKLAVDLHYVIAREADAELSSFKTRITPLENVVIGDGDANSAFDGAATSTALRGSGDLDRNGHSEA